METAKPRKLRTVRAPDLRRAEFVSIAERLFQTKGYEATTIADVISAAGVSKGAFYHHFKAKEELLEAIVARAATVALGYFERLRADETLDALTRLNRLLAMGRDWKLEHMGQLRRTFETALRRDEDTLTARTVEATFSVLSPAIASLIAEGQSEGTIGAGDPAAMADALLWMGYGRRRMMSGLLLLVDRDPEAVANTLYARCCAEQVIMDRILGLPPGSIRLIGTSEELRQFVTAWLQAAPAEG
jgi:AcrR family transcriptional regulator